MSVRDLIPWGREESRIPSLFRDSERIRSCHCTARSTVCSTTSSAVLMAACLPSAGHMPSVGTGRASRSPTTTRRSR